MKKPAADVNLRHLRYFVALAECADGRRTIRVSIPSEAVRFEQIRVSVAYNRANVKLVGTHAGVGIGEDGYSQMGLEDVALMRTLPNMVVVQPADALEAEQAVECLAAHDGPAYLRVTRQKVADVSPAGYRFQLGTVDASLEGGTVHPGAWPRGSTAHEQPGQHGQQQGEDDERRGHTSRLRTNFALSSMNRRRGSTSSPISVSNSTDAWAASSSSTLRMVRVAGSIVVFHSWSGFISPSPL